jgi:nucleotide-binding universal stress UspA family protein
VANDGNVIVVGVDGSSGSDRAVDWALTEARVHGDRVMLVHSWEFPSFGVTNFAGDPLPVFGHDDIERLASEVLDAAVSGAKAKAPEVEVSGHLVEGHPGSALIDASAGARLLVVGSRGLGGFKGMVMGSVSSSCVHHARCPVVVIPPAQPAAGS